MSERVKHMRRWLAKRVLGFWTLVGMLALTAALAASIDHTRPHVDGTPLRFDAFVDLIEAGRVDDARILNWDSYVVGTYRSGGRRVRYAVPYLKSFAASGGVGTQERLIDLLLDYRVPTAVDQQYSKSVASTLSVVIPGLMAVLLLVYLVVSWRRGTGLFGVRSGARRVQRSDPRVRFSDVAGQDAAVAELREVADFLTEPARFAAVGARIPRGVLLFGPPGSGKTLLARALAGETGAAFFYTSASAFSELYVGVGASRVRDLFREAREHAPAIVFIDELDAIGRRRAGSGSPQDGGEREQALNQILTEMDGFSPTAGVVVVGATNRPDVLDPALLRPGRFDRSVGLARTDEHGRLAVLEVHARGKPLAPGADLASVARRAVGFTGADLANLVNEAGLLAGRAGRTAIGQEHLDEALRRIREAPEHQRRLAMRGRSPGRQAVADSRVTFADIAGVDSVLEELGDVRAYLDEPERFDRLGARAPRGYLLVGPSGTGKTMLARALAEETNAAFFWMGASEFTEVFVGEGAGRVRDFFAEARAMAPAIVFIDEIDAIGGRRSASPDGGGGRREMENTLNQILIELDGFGGREGVVVLAATNRPDLLDAALVRPGRFDRRITFHLPDRAGRLAILRVHARDKPLAAGASLEDLARLTQGFSGADLANLLNEAALVAARRGLDRIGRAELDAAFDRVTLGIAGAHRMSDDDRRIVAYHEAGHALVARALASDRLPHRLSLVPRTTTLGHVVFADGKDNLVHSRSGLLDELAVSLGGHVAEELVFGEPSSGNGDDLRHVASTARRMVVEWGMAGAVAALAHPNGAGAYSEQTASRIDAEVTALVDEARSRARRVLDSERHVLDRIAEALLDRETLSADELEGLAR